VKKALLVTAFLAMLPASTLIVTPTPALASADALACPADAATAGAKVYKKCKACHVANKKKNKAGPHLVGIVGRKVGSVEGYRYSKAMKKVAEEGMEWTEANLDEFLTKPKKFVPKTKMGFRGLKKESQRTSLICYLKGLDEQAS
jgi:cytochrome c2